jgi:hypothetical protein
MEGIMFCPHCGIEYSQKLNYCKRCGGGLSLPVTSVGTPSSRPKFAAMFWAVAMLGLGGLGMAFGILATMASFDMRGDELIIPFVFTLIFIFGLAGLLIWQLSRIISSYQQTNRAASFERPTLGESRPAQIPAPPDALPSAVEHTTRQFAHPSYKEPMPRE